MAAFGTDAVNAAIGELLPQLDDDTRDYVGSVMTSGDMDLEEMRETVAGFIVSFGVTEDDDEAAELVGKLLDKLQIDEDAVGHDIGQ